MTPCKTCGLSEDSGTHWAPKWSGGHDYVPLPPTLTVRWWRDPEDRYLSRPEYHKRQERRHFNLSEVPRGDNPELDAFVEHYRDTIGFAHPGFIYYRYDPDPIKDVLRYHTTHIDPLRYGLRKPFGV
jgi:hypothetical protein